MSRVIAAFTQFFDGNGDPLANGWLRFLQSNTNNTLKTTWSDSNLSLPNENPLQLDAEGRVPNVFGQGSYRVDLFYDNPVTHVPGELVQSFDPVSTFDTPTGAEGNFAEWSNTTVYQVSNIVIYNGLYYRSITADNLGNAPDTNTDQWEQITFLRYYNPDVVYQTDDIVISGGALYFSLVDNNTGNDPFSSPAYWGAVGAGTVLLNWEEWSSVFRPKVSGYDIGDSTHYVGDIYLNAFADFPVTPSTDPTADYHITNKLYVDNQVAGRMRWLGEWSPGTYSPYDVVWDEGWRMIAITETTDRPSPQAIGDSLWVYDTFSPAGFSETSDSQPTLFIGQRYEYTTAFFTQKLRVYLPATAVGDECEVWMVYNADTDPSIRVIIPGFTIESNLTDKWSEIPIGTQFIEAGSVIDFLMIIRPATGELTFTSSWTYAKDNTDPTQGLIHHKSDASQLLVHAYDSSLVDQTTNLDLIVPGSWITMDATGAIWEVLQVSYASDIYTFTVEPASRSNEGLSDFTFTYYSSTPIYYVYETDLYLTDARISGYFATEYDPTNATYFNDNAYGIDIKVQNAIASADWEIVAYPPSVVAGSSGSGLVNWEESGTILRPVVSDAGQLGDATHLISGLYLGDSSNIYLGDDQDLSIVHDGTDSYILNGTGFLSIGTSAATSLYLTTNNTPHWAIDSAGELLPVTDSTYSIGSTSLRVLKLWSDDIESTNVPTIAGGSFIDAAVPDQSGHSEEFLTTDGSAVSWSPITVLTEQENALYNPLMSVWQRGAGTFSTGSSYTADNVKLYLSGTAAYIDQTTGTTINGYTYTEYGVAITHTAGSATTDYCQFVSFVENVGRIQNTTATINIVANIPSGNSCAVSCTQYSGTTVLNQVAASALLVGTGAVEVYTVTVSLPDISGETLTIEDSYLSIEFWTDAGSSYDARTNSLGHQPSGTIYVYAMQIRPGVRDSIIEIPTPRQNLDNCYRYYYRHSQPVAGRHFCNCFAGSGNQAFGVYDCPTTFRKSPAFTYPALSDFGVVLGSTGYTPPLVYSLIYNNINKPVMYMQFAASTFPALVGYGGAFYPTTASTYIELSSEF